MPKETSLRELMRAAVGICTSGVIVGKVSKADPIEILVENDAKLILSGDNLYVPKHLTDYTVTVTLPVLGTVSCRVHNALKTGEQVYLLSYEEGSQYFVLDKVG